MDDPRDRGRSDKSSGGGLPFPRLRHGFKPGQMFAVLADSGFVSARVGVLDPLAYLRDELLTITTHQVM